VLHIIARPAFVDMHLADALLDFVFDPILDVDPESLTFIFPYHYAIRHFVIFSVIFLGRIFTKLGKMINRQTRLFFVAAAGTYMSAVGHGHNGSVQFLNQSFVETIT